MSEREAHAVAHAHGSHAHAHDHGPVDPDLAESRAGVRVLMISLVMLGITAAAQAIVVWLTGSVALFADTIHNVGDALTAVPLAIAFVLSRRPPSRRFAYGLGRTEDLAGLVIVVLIGFSGVVALWQSVDRLLHPQTPNYLEAGIAAGVLGFVGNELVAVYRIRQGRRMASAALIADGQHARVDGFTSLGVAAGLIGVALGFELADPIVGIAISLVIGRIAWNAAKDVGIRLLDGVEPAHAEPIARVARTTLGEDRVLDVRSRWLGHVIHVEVLAEPLAGEDLQLVADELVAAWRAAGTRARSVTLAVARAPAAASPRPEG